MTKSVLLAAVLPQHISSTPMPVGPSQRESHVTGPPPTVETGFKVSIFSKHLQWLNYADMAKVAADVGFDGVDLTVRPDGHVLPQNVTNDLPKAVDAVRKAGLDVYSIVTSITDPADPFTEPILKAANKLGIGYYRTGWLPYRAGLSIPQNLDLIRAKFTKLAQMNQLYGLHGAYQNHSDANFGAAVWDLWMVLKDLDPRWLGCQYDIRHATVEGAASWPNALNALKTHIRTIDIKDFRWTEKNGRATVENVPLGTGTIDYKKYFSLLSQHAISGPVSLHCEYPLGGAEHGKKELTIGKEAVLNAMRNDLGVLRKWLTDARLK